MRQNDEIVAADIEDEARRANPVQRRSILRGALYLLATLVAAGPAPSAKAAPLELPAITDPASNEHHPGKVIFLELVTPDVAGAKQFYGRLLGWTFRDIAADGTAYAEASLDGRPVAGLVQRPIPPGEQRQPTWLSFFAVEDVDAAAKAAEERGAKLLFPPHSFPNRGREAVLADPQGAVFAVLASSSGDPPDFLAAPGEWIWSSLITTDPDTAAAFYQALFGYEVFELPDEADTQHLLFASQDYARASDNSLPDQASRLPPHWLNYVRVEDATKMAAQAVALGGRVLVEPRLDRQGGKLAVITDPQGAPFGLLEWVERESKEVPR